MIFVPGGPHEVPSAPPQADPAPRRGRLRDDRTGPAAARVVEVAALRLDPGAAPTWFHSLIDPGVPIPPAASVVHGIRDRDVAGKPRFETVAHVLHPFLRGADLVAYNAGFDLGVLTAEFARVGLRFKVKGRAVVDPLAVFRRRSRGPWPTR